MKTNKTIHLYTEAGKSLAGIPWDRYPRPQMRRDSFFCLNGEWDFSANGGEVVGNLISGSSAFSKTSLNIRKITVHILLKPGLENFEHKRRLVLGVHWRD